MRIAFLKSKKANLGVTLFQFKKNSVTLASLAKLFSINEYDAVTLMTLYSLPFICYAFSYKFIYLFNVLRVEKYRHSVTFPLPQNLTAYIIIGYRHKKRDAFAFNSVTIASPSSNSVTLFNKTKETSLCGLP